MLSRVARASPRRVSRLVGILTVVALVGRLVLVVPVALAGSVNPPVAGADAWSIDEDAVLSVPAPGVLGNDTDADGDLLTAVVVDVPGHGALTLNPDGSFTYTPTANYSGADSFTYRVLDGGSDMSGGLGTVSISVMPVADAQAITFSALGGATYGDAPVALSASASSGLTVTFTGTGDCAVVDSTLTITGAGRCTVTAHQAGNASFDAAIDVSRTFSIGKTALKISVDRSARTLGGPIPTFTVTYRGFVNGDDATDLTGTLAFSTTATAASGAGTYVVSASGITSGDYTITYAAGNLSVGAGAQSIAFDSLPNVTDGLAPITLVATASSGLTVTFGTIGACTVVGSILTVTGAGECTVIAYQFGNASINAATRVIRSFSIAKGAPAIDYRTPADLIYGQPIPTNPASATADVPGTFAYRPAEGTILHAGVHVVHVTFTATDADIEGVVEFDIAITVHPAALTVTVDDSTRTYGAPNGTFAITAAGLVNGDVPDDLAGLPDFRTDAVVASPVGRYPVTCRACRRTTTTSPSPPGFSPSPRPVSRSA